MASLCFLLGEAAAAVLDGSEDSGGHVIVIHRGSALRVQALCEELASLDGHGRELQLAVEDVTDGIDVRHVGLLVLGGNLAVLGVCLHASHVEVEELRVCVPACCKEDGVVLFRLLLAVMSERDCQLAVILLHNRLGCSGTDQLGTVLLHVVADALRNVLVEPAEENRPHHHSGVVPESDKEASALKSDVGGTDNKRLAWVVVELEDVVTSDGMLRARDVKNGRPATNSNDDLLCSEFLHAFVPERERHLVRPKEFRKCVVILHLVRA
mmetsp:Transcript_16225/g.63268  ORF Transcript_16225/g.63268 Transcript_16225/m.63268 type:complete len:268 (-) Transcript_16225:507-1310(-)